MFNLAGQIEDIFTNSGKLREVDALLRKNLRPPKQGKNNVWNDAVNSIRNSLKDSMPPQYRDALKLLNSRYGNARALGKASQTKDAMMGKNITPKTLATGVKQSSTPRAVEEGSGNFQQELRDWTEVVGEPGGVIPVLKRRAIQAFPEVPGVMRVPGDMVAGNYKYQRAMRDAMKSPKAQVLKRAISPYRLGAALEEEEN